MGKHPCCIQDTLSSSALTVRCIMLLIFVFGTHLEFFEIETDYNPNLDVHCPED